MYNKNHRNHLRSVGLSILGFTLGGLLGSLLIWLLLRSSLIEQLLSGIDPSQEIIRLLVGIGLVILMIAISGFIHGSFGGWSFSWFDRLAPRRRYIIAGGISFGLVEGILIPVFLLLTALIAIINNNADIKGDGLSVLFLFSIYGIVFGLLTGVFFGILSVGFKNSWRVILAGILGSTIAGAILGLLLRYILALSNDGAQLNWPWITIGLGLVINLIIGSSFGMVYSWFAEQRATKGNLPAGVSKFWRIVGAIVAIILLVGTIRVATTLIKFATIREGSLSSVIPSKTVGVSWAEQEMILNAVPEGSSPTSQTIGTDGHPVVTWAGEADRSIDIFYTKAIYEDGRLIGWSEPVNVSNSPDALSMNPQVVSDKSGTLHFVWSEEDQNNPQGNVILYSRCIDNSCSSPAQLSDPNGEYCGLHQTSDIGNHQPVIALEPDGNAMVVWNAGDGLLPYVTWPANEEPPSSSYGCIPTEDRRSIWGLNLVSNGAGSYSLAYTNNENEREREVLTSNFQEGGWDQAPTSVGQGGPATLFSDSTGKIHLAWCDSPRLEHEPNPKLYYQNPAGLVETIDYPLCLSQPAISEDGFGNIHLLWYSDEVGNHADVLSRGHFIYESVRNSQYWSPAAIAFQTSESTQQEVTSGPDQNLFMTWTDSDKILYAIQPHYDCSKIAPTEISQGILDVLNNGNYRPAGETIPYCQNRFDRLVYMPNPEPSFSSQPPEPNGGYDKIGDLITQAQYEVLLTTMEWQKNDNQDSPGFRIIQGVVDLYNQVAANPEDYPRGMTVRILLGNYPDLSTFEWGSQIWHVMEDLKEAGLPEMENPEIGWRVEVANFDGQIPHSHTKFVVLDGKTVLAAGFNTSYLHLPFGHPSEKGAELVDLGIQLTGPAAQAALAVFDDQWEGADKLVCNTLDPFLGIWELACNFQKASADHTPEVMKYYLPDNESTAYSLYRNKNYHESDEAIYNAVSSAKTSLDVFQVNFSLEVYCSLAMINPEICTYNDALPYMEAIVEAIEKNQVYVRVLVTDVNMNGVENSVAIRILSEELARRGLRDLVEFRYYRGRMHPKAVLIDSDLLIIGSQNFHYSAFGEAGLAEYSLATEDPQAIEEFKNAFDYYWIQGVPAESAELRSE